MSTKMSDESVEKISEKEAVVETEESPVESPKIKTLNKNIRFNYFRGFLIVDKEILENCEKEKKHLESLKEKFTKKPSKELQEKIEAEDEILKEYNVFKDYQAIPWDMKDMLKDIYDKKMTDTSINLGDIIVEIEPNSISGIEGNIIGFQLTKMRDNMLPAKKKKGKIKEEINLNDDEYIGDFVSILYDSMLNVFMIQSNSYGLTINQIQKYLTQLRRKYIKLTNDKDMIQELACELRVLIDPKKVEHILDSKFYRKIRIKGSDFMLDSLISKDKDGYKKFGTIRNCMGETRGVNFDITFSVQSNKKTETLNHDDVEEIINEFNKVNDDKDKPQIEVTKKDNEDSNVEMVNLLYPRLNNIISFKIQARTSIGNDFLFDKMNETYNNTRGVISRVVSN